MSWKYDLPLKFKLDHPGIVVKDLEKAIEFYSKYLGCQKTKIFESGEVKKYFEKEEPGNVFRYMFMRIGDDYLELLQPIEGPFVDLLKKHGDGAMVELCFDISNLERYYDDMKKQGITLTDMDGNPLVEKKFISSPSGNKFAYLPRKISGGTWIELFERGWR